jgi:O-antigen ligase
VLLAAKRKTNKPPAYLKVVIPLSTCLYGVLAFGLGVDINAVIAGALGRDPTLTDRTRIWEVVLSISTNPILGAGYESFWLGSRLQKVWMVFPGINEAHNGYLQMYLQLGFVGLTILVWMLMSFFGSIWKNREPFAPIATFSLALWTVLAYYNVTEAAFQGGVLWLVLLPGVLYVGGVGNEGSKNRLERGRVGNVRIRTGQTKTGRYGT